MWKAASHPESEASDAGEIETAATSSVIPAIDELVVRYTGRGTVAAPEIIDALLDLRLLAEADELIWRELPSSAFS
jgi:hypothetical protein